jgi:D-alanyl-D-alanine carboxypeptidase/D-alanyl-D-alanine-endopeptidase (penicillin-binding protein 4)
LLGLTLLSGGVLLYAQEAGADGAADLADGAAENPAPEEPTGTAPSANNPAENATPAPIKGDTLPTRPSDPRLVQQTAAIKKFERELIGLFDSTRTRGRLGLAVWSTAQQRWLHAINADTLFSPASTLKLVTTATALDLYDPDWFPHTDLELRGRLEGRKFTGRLVAKGYGDPNISGRFYPDPLFVLRSWGKSLREAGIDTLEGSIEVDRFYFSDAAYPETWRNKFRDEWYGAEVTGLVFNDNCALLRILPGLAPGDSALVQIEPDVGHYEIDRTGLQTVAGRKRSVSWSLDPWRNKVTARGTIGVDASPVGDVVPVRHAEYWFEAGLRRGLRDAGFEVIPARPSTDLPLYATFRFRTAPLQSLLTEVNQKSQNLHAEITLRQSGAKAYGAATVAKGLRAEREFLTRLKIDTNQFVLRDGSGLTYENRVTPRGVAELLRAMLHHRNGAAWRETLAQPILVGSRLRRFPFPTRTRYKTGFIAQVQGLSGYIATATGDTLCIALYQNGYRVVDQIARDLQDSIWIRLGNHYDPERAALAEARLTWNRADSTQDSAPSAGAPADSLRKPAPLKPWSAPELQERLRRFTEGWIGRPYLAGPTGEGPYGSVSAAPLMRLDAFDCVTYIEHALALARATSQDSLLTTLTAIRYSAEPAGPSDLWGAAVERATSDSSRAGDATFLRRRHFFIEDWLKPQARGPHPIVRPLTSDQDTTAHRTMGRRKFLALNGLDTTGVKDQPSELRFLPKAAAIARYDAPWTGPRQILGVSLIGDVDWLWSLHTGFILLEPGQRPIFRHASSKKMVVTQEPLADYLRGRGNLIGIVPFEFLE